MTRRRSRWRSLRLALVIACLCGAVLVADRAGTALVVDAPLVDPQAIIVLGSHEWERLPAAAALAQRHPAAVVFLTVPKAVTKYNCHDCAARAERLVAAGVAPARIVELSFLVSNTRDEAIAARAECLQRNYTRLLIVTSPYHTRRARATFESVFAGTGITVGIVPSSASPARPRRWWMAAYDRAYVRYEWAAILYHAVRP